MLQNTHIQEEEVDKTVLKPEEINFKKFISPYRLDFQQQLDFNRKFNIEDDKPQDGSAEKLKDFLQKKLNEAFKDQEKLSSYQEAIRADKTTSDRGIHDGFHVANVALYAKNFLKIYQENKELFSPEIQKEIEEFNDEKKVKDLEILCLLHDVARVNKDLDQDEYKNAFYVALMLREIGDERFQGDEISEEGLKMIMDLASKESDAKDKSLMSKLIQGADSLAILRVKKFNTGETLFDPNLNNVYNDFKKIDPKNNTVARNKLINIWRGRMQPEVLKVENKEHITTPFLEFTQNPLEEFVKHEKTQKLLKAFLAYDEINSGDKKNDFTIEQSSGAVFIHVFSSSNNDALQKCDSRKFICATMLRDGSHVKHYAEWSWINNPFLILDKDATIFQAGFTTDVGSNVLNNSLKRNFSSIFFGALRGFQSDIQMSNYVALQWQTRPVQFYFDNMTFHQDAFYLKLKEISDRRSGDQPDISDGTYWLTDGAGNRQQGRIGFERFGEDYSKPDFSREALSNELRHNECHIRNSVHISHRVGISDFTFNFLPSSSNHPYSDHAESGLFRLQKYKNQINAEKQRLLALAEPMKDEKFKECVNFELSRVTSLFEKIHFLQQMRKEINDNPDNEYWIKSSQKKRTKKSESDGFVFEISDVNRKIWSERKIAKINKNLVELFANLHDFEKEENFGFQDLISELEDLTSGGCNLHQFKEKIVDWKSKIMSDEANPQLKFAIDKVRAGLQMETKMGLHNVYKPQEFMVLTDEGLEERFKEITSKISEPESLFQLYFNTERYLDILRIFDREKITEYSKDADFDQIVFTNKFKDHTTKQETEQLIDAGLDIHKFNDKEAETDCLSFMKSKPILQPYSYKTAKKLNNAEVVESLLEHGVLISDKFNLAENDVEKNMAEFCKKLKAKNAEVLNSLKLALEKYESKENLKDVTTLSFGGKDIKLNGYGLLRIFENNLIKDPSPEISQLFIKVNSFKTSRVTDSNSTSIVGAELGFFVNPREPSPVEISFAQDPVIISPDEVDSGGVDSDVVDSGVVDSGAGVGLRKPTQSQSHLYPPEQANQMR